ncbi:MAG: glycosyltransferase family 2 protein [Fibromonadaceae bacterium]|jgi:glycosyltransferase involved in cell wall biosynthesis|nr:glycosyltransferase family 2 protein [Fibromonadaceae bacterium]
MTKYIPTPIIKYPKQKELISIIVPIYNTKEIYLRECLDSILTQTFTNWEAILVNDGSTDRTGKIIDEYAKKDSRFIAVHKQNEGTLLARKSGLENSRGEFIANLDHDDYYYPQFLKKMYAKIKETDADFVYCHCNASLAGKNYKLSEDVSESIAMMYLHSTEMGYALWNKLVKREIYAKVNFPNINIVIGEDPIQLLQIIYHSKSVAFIPEVLYFYRGENSTVQKMNHIAMVKNITLQKKTLSYLFNKNIPLNVKNAFCHINYVAVYSYFSLNKQQRMEFKNELEPFLPELIKRNKKLSLKICLFLANKGIEQPLKLREALKEYRKPLLPTFSTLPL